MLSVVLRDKIIGERVLNVELVTKINNKQDLDDTRKISLT